MAVGRPLKIIEKSLFFKGFAGLRASRRGGVAVLKRLGAIWDVFGRIWAVLKRLGASWGGLEAVLGRLGAVLARLGAV